MKKFRFLKKVGIKKLPKKPGVYCFKEKKILYVGKAANIQDRVKNHFQRPEFKESIFLDKVRKIGFIETDSEIEALILEANLIKKCQPKYNVVWRDDKNYFYVGITKPARHRPKPQALAGGEDFPLVFITHQPKKLYPKPYTLNPEFVGPFVDGRALKQTLRILRKIFPYRTCCVGTVGKTLPKRPCLWYQLDRCPAPCLLESPKESLRLPTGQAKLSSQIPGLREKIKRECQKNAKNLLKILQGKRIQVLRNLKKEVKGLSNLQEFERAAKIRDKIFALEKILNNAKIFEVQKAEIKYSEIEKGLKKILKTKKKIKRIEAYDVSNISGKLATGSMITFIRGLVAKEFYRKFKIKISGKSDDVAMLKECLIRRFKHSEWGKPDLILIDGGKAQLNAALSCLTSEVKHVEVVAIAKKKNELYLENRKKPILLKSLPREIFNLILQLRDEAHRFAISYHRKLRKEKMLTRD
ncbi:GIY-YIG nuclease family protein [Patescibacteria group bacterium]|nr:GIY-YIG nuclease family protein [Patescibacteria group bacterium]